MRGMQHGRTLFAVAGALAASAAACSAIDDRSPEDCAELSCVAEEQAYSYRPTREAEPPIDPPVLPATSLPESAYTAIESEITHVVTFSADLGQLEAISSTDGERLLGTQRERGAQRIVYDLDAFAGGELSVWFHGGKLEAEITLFGSGLPI